MLQEVKGFVSQYSVIISMTGAFVAAGVGWFITIVSWKKLHANNIDLEKRKFESNIELEKEKYNSSIRLERKKAELKFVNDQLQNLYGPLYAIGKSSSMAMSTFLKIYAPGQIRFFGDRNITEKEFAAWRLWMSEVMMPLNLQMERTVIQNMHLIEDVEIPISMSLFLSHIASYKAVIKNWSDHEKNNTLKTLTKEDHLPAIPFPQAFHNEIGDMFARLKIKQEKLISDAVEIDARNLDVYMNNLRSNGSNTNMSNNINNSSVQIS